MQKKNHVCFYKKTQKYIEYGLQKNELHTILDNAKYSEIFDEIADKYGVNYGVTWLLSEFISRSNNQNKTTQEEILNGKYIQDIVKNLKNGEINAPAGKILMDEIFKSPHNIDDLIDKLSLKQNNNEEEIVQICEKIIQNNLTQVEQYKSGKDKLFGFFVGKAMQETKGKANPEIINKILINMLQK